MIDRSVAVLPAEGGRQPSDRGTQQERGANHEGQNDPAASRTRYRITRLRNPLRNAAVGVGLGKPSSGLHQADKVSAIVGSHSAVSKA